MIKFADWQLGALLPPIDQPLQGSVLNIGTRVAPTKEP